MVDRESKSIKFSWNLKLASNEHNNIKIFLENFALIEHDISYILRTNKLDTGNHKILKRLLIFFQEILEIFNETKYSLVIDKITTYNFLKQPILGNRIFQYKNETLFFRKLA